MTPATLRRSGAALLAVLLAQPAGAGSTDAPAPATDPCAQAVSTLDMADCRAEQLRAAQATLQRYLQAARRQAQAGGVEPRQFNRAQATWQAYARQHCDNVHQYWIDGSIRHEMAQQCQLALLRARTHTLWRDHLTFMDSTPPVLPEPAR